jgi:hypothetical protein
MTKTPKNVVEGPRTGPSTTQREQKDPISHKEKVWEVTETDRKRESLGRTGEMGQSGARGRGSKREKGEAKGSKGKQKGARGSKREQGEVIGVWRVGRNRGDKRGADYGMVRREGRGTEEGTGKQKGRIKRNLERDDREGRKRKSAVWVNHRHFFCRTGKGLKTFP